MAVWMESLRLWRRCEVEGEVVGRGGGLLVVVCAGGVSGCASGGVCGGVCGGGAKGGRAGGWG